MKASTDSILSRDLDGWENWSSWIPPQELSKMAPVYKAGYDFDGLPGKHLTTKLKTSLNGHQVRMTVVVYLQFTSWNMVSGTIERWRIYQTMR